MPYAKFTDGFRPHMQVKATTPPSSCCNATARSCGRKLAGISTISPAAFRWLNLCVVGDLSMHAAFGSSWPDGGPQKGPYMLKMARYTALAAALIAGPATLCFAQAGGGGGAAGGGGGAAGGTSGTSGGGTSGGAGGAGSMGAGSLRSGAGTGIGGSGTSGSTTTGSTLSGNNSGSSGAAGTGPNTSGGSTGTGSTTR
jgi:hypothetical protein